jgi:hypothetical protein
MASRPTRNLPRAGDEAEREVDMSAGTSVIVAMVVYAFLIGIQFYLAGRLSGGDEEPGTPENTVSFFGPFGHAGWDGRASRYGSWGPGHWTHRPGDRDSYP